MSGAVAISTRVRLARNVKGYLFPSGKKGEETFLKPIEKTLSAFGRFKRYEMGKVSRITAESLVERHLISPDLIKNRESGGALVSDDGMYSVMLNEEDHVREQCMLSGMSLKEAYEKIVKLDETLSRSLLFMYTENLGYITRCPTNLGTGMRASVMLFLPALTLSGQMSKLCAAASRQGITVRGAYGEGSAAEGYLYQVSNRFTLGVTEYEIVERVTLAAGALCEGELAERNKLIESRFLYVKDRVMRAYGVLANAVMLSSEEFMRLFADYRFGRGIGLFAGGDGGCQQLVERVQPAGIILQAGRDLTAEERDVLRANLVADFVRR